MAELKKEYAHGLGDCVDYYNSYASKYARAYERPIQQYLKRVLQMQISKYTHPNDRVLDVGCGTGLTLKLLSEMNRVTVFCSDKSYGMVEIAFQHRPNQKLNSHYFLDDASSMGVKSDSFDVVTAFAVLNYIPNLRAVFEEVRRVLRPGGLFIITVINRREFALLLRLPYYTLAKMLKRSGGLGDLEIRYCKEELLSFFLTTGFEIIEYKGIRFLPDCLPPFLNSKRPFFPFTASLIRLLSPFDDRLCRNVKINKYARFHFVVEKATN